MKNIKWLLHEYFVIVVKFGRHQLRIIYTLFIVKTLLSA